MPFQCDEATRARLEWPRLAAALAREAATARGKEACQGELFAATRASARDRLAETDEARALLDAAEPLPLGGLRDLRGPLERAVIGAVLSPAELTGFLDTLRSALRLRAFLGARAGRAPRLADLAQSLPAPHSQLDSLAHRLAEKMTSEGELRDDATPELARLSRQVRTLENEIDAKMAAALRDPNVRPYLQDNFVTEREGRPCLPVRADARGRVRGWVHDVSASGTTVFVEPEPVVELGNRLRIARSERAHEIDRCLAELTGFVREARPELEALGHTLLVIDLAQARGRLSRRLLAARPAVDDTAALELFALQHPLLLLETALSPDRVIANDVAPEPTVRALVISGPNAGGKTITAKAVGLAALMVRAGLHVPCAEGSRLPLFDAVYADIGDEQDLRSGLSTFSARMANIARILREADDRTLVILDEIGEGTEPGEGAALAQAVLEALVERGAFVIATTHFNRLKELAGGDSRFANASAEFDRATLLPTYRVRLGAPGSSAASYVAARMGIASEVVERARSLLDREDRRLEALTDKLSELRQELEAERVEAHAMLEASEGARAAYESKLETLREAREHALGAMKRELEAAYRGARDEIARVVRGLQQSAAPAHAANRARDELREIQTSLAQTERAHVPPVPARAALDWAALAPGARLLLEGVQSEAELVRGPDARGRIEVRARGARLVLPKERALRALPPVPAATGARKPLPAVVERAPEAAALRCDLRGLRVDEALERAEAHLQQFLGRSAPELPLIHGHGTGALRSALRAWLTRLPYVETFEPAPASAGGNGVTLVRLRH